MAQIKFNSNVYGTGTQDDPITCSDFDDFQFLLNNADTTNFYYKIVDGKYYYETTYIDGSWDYFNIHFIALDPNAENKVFDCNEFSIGQHGLTNQGLRPFNTLRTNFTIFGNNWVFKNFWWLSNRFEGFFNAGPTDSSGNYYDNRTITINKLHFLNCFHSGEGSHELVMFGDNYDGGVNRATSIKWIFNDCKFSILTSGGTNYSITRTCSSLAPKDEFNRCSFNILCTSPDFHMNIYLSGSSVIYCENKFTNCNFRINARYTSTLFNFGNWGNTSPNYPVYKFCKFTGEIRGESSFNKGTNFTTSSGEKGESNVNPIKDYMFLNCFWQLNFPDSVNNKCISDISTGIRNTDHSDNMATKTELPNSSTSYLKNTISLSKEDCLNVNKLLENNFPVMTKIKTDSTEV